MIKTRLIRPRMGGISVQLAHVVPLGFNGRSEGVYWSRFGLAGCVNWVILGRRLAVSLGSYLWSLYKDCWLDRTCVGRRTSI